MPTTTALALRYPDPTDRVADGYLAIEQLAEDVEEKLPRGHAGSISDATPLTLAVVGTAYESTPTRITISAKPGQRRYKVQVLGQFNLASAGVGLYRVQALATAGTLTGRPGQNKTDVAGGPGQVSAVGLYTLLVPAATAVTVSVQGARVDAGGATDSMVSSCIHISDDGPV